MAKYKSINITKEQIAATGFDFGQRVSYVGGCYDGQQGTVVGFDGDFPSVHAYVNWDNPEDATSAACVSTRNLKAV